LKNDYTHRVYSGNKNFSEIDPFQKYSGGSWLIGSWHWKSDCKGQLISIGNLCVFNSSKKRMKNFCPSRLEQNWNFQVRFLEELKTSNCPFEINWPLVRNYALPFWCYIWSPKYINFVWVSWFLAPNLSNFVSLPWKRGNQYCYSLHSIAI
jgi:hypothetical protein